MTKIVSEKCDISFEEKSNFKALIDDVKYRERREIFFNRINIMLTIEYIELLQLVVTLPRHSYDK